MVLLSEKGPQQNHSGILEGTVFTLFQLRPEHDQMG